MNNEPVAWMDEDENVVFEKCKVYPIPLYTHPVKELHLSLQKSKQTGELLAVTYTDDEHRIVEVLWQKPPALTDEEIALVWDKFSALPSPKDIKGFAKAILRKASEK
jgi:hypothetical protein